MIVLLTLGLIACLLSLTDGLRFELIRALQSAPERSHTFLIWRLVATLPIGWLWAGLIANWSQAEPFGLAMVTFTGTMTACWLWMMGWIKTYVADPTHPKRQGNFIQVGLSSLLSFNVWLAIFTLPALLVAFSTDVFTPVLFLAATFFGIGDALLLALAGRMNWGKRWITDETRQRLISRLGGTALVGLSIWALISSFE